MDILIGLVCIMDIWIGFWIDRLFGLVFWYRGYIVWIGFLVLWIGFLVLWISFLLFKFVIGFESGI